MQRKELIVGIIKQNSYLETDQGKILLTKIPMHAAQNPESSALEIVPEDLDKTAVVKGSLSGNVLYSARILEILPSLTSALIKGLIQKDIISFKEIRAQLSDFESKEKRKFCALVVGHKKASPGAVNKRTGTTEFEFNDELASRIEMKVKNVDIQRVYRRIYKELPDDINTLNPDFIVSLHCNAFNTKVSGTEMLYYYKSEKGRKMAGILLKHLLDHLKLPDRGVKSKTAEDRGGYLLRYTKAPTVIAEPFFIDNDNDLDRARGDINGLAAAYARAIEEIAEAV